MIAIWVVAAGCGGDDPAMPVGESDDRSGVADSPDAGTTDDGEAEALREVRAFADTLFQFQRVQLLVDGAAENGSGLTAEQIDAVRPLAAQAEELWAELRRLPADDRDGRLEADFVPAARAIEERLDAVLDGEQDGVLFRQVLRRQHGAIAFLMPGVAKELELSAAQRAEIEEIVLEGRRAFDWNRLGATDIPRLLVMTRRNRQRVLEMLSDAQRERWSALVD